MTTQKRNLYILLLVLFVVMLGYGMITPLLPFYIEDMGAGGAELGLLVASYSVMRMVCGPVWGSLSDRIGRKPVLLIGIFGYVITMLWFGLATRLWMLFAARILAGILSSATAPTTMAFVSDSTPEEERGGGMGMLGAASGIGAILGPVLGGLLGDESISLPFFAAALVAALSLLLAWVFLPESLPPEKRLTDKPGKVNFIDLRGWVNAVRSPVGPLFNLTFISTCGLMIFASVFGLYALERFSFGPKEAGVMIMVLGLVSALVQGVFAGPLTRRWGDVTILKASLFASAAGFGFLLLADSTLTILLATAFFGFTTALQVPSLTAMTSKRSEVPPGAAMGLSNAFISLGRIFGPLAGGFLLDVNLLLPFLAGAAVMLLGFLVSLGQKKQVQIA